jgi:hypothetical protein
MPPKKAAAGKVRARDASGDEGSATPGNDAKRAAKDPLVFTNEDVKRPMTIARLFAEKLNYGFGSVMHPDWTELRRALASRTSASPTWFIQVAEDELGTETPPGCTKEAVVCVPYVGIAEAAGATRAPSTFIIREHRVFADDEDCVPEKVRTFAAHGFCWLQVLGEACEDINVYLLVTDAERVALTGNAAAQSFGFGAAAPSSLPPPAPAPSLASDVDAAAPAAATGAPGTGMSAPTREASAMSMGFGSPAVSFGGNGFAGFATTTTGTGFGASAASQHSAAEAPPPPPPSRDASSASSNFAAGFGNAATSQPPSFAAGFGNAAASQPPSFATGFGATEGGSFALGFGANAAQAPSKPATDSAAPLAVDAAVVSGVPRHAKDVNWLIWSLKSLTDMRARTTQGSRISRRDVALPDGTTWPKLVMQNDLKDRVAATVAQLIDKQFARTNARMVRFVKWRGDCPEVEPKLIEPLEAMQASLLKAEKAASTAEFDAVARHRDALVAALEEIVAQRKAEVAAELATLDEARRQLTAGEALPRDRFRVLKYYPANDVVRFRPHGKLRSLTDAGQPVDVCTPPAYQNRSSFGGFRRA